MKCMHRSILRSSAGLIVAGILFPTLPLVAAPNIVLWDARAPVAATVTTTDPATWQRVPGELFSFEQDPAKAASDPGYYGREYRFEGDAVVENHQLAAVFRVREGTVSFYARVVAGATLPEFEKPQALGRLIADVVPLSRASGAPSIRRLEVIRNADDEVAVEAVFAAAGAPDLTAVFAFDRNRVVEIRPGAGTTGFRLKGALDHVVVPSFIGDDLVYPDAGESAATPWSVPAGNSLLGLLHGEDAEFILTWPGSGQRVTLRPGTVGGGSSGFEAVDLETGGKSFYLAALRSPGIWHREPLTPAFLEKDVTVDWKRPFPAKWKTQLLEAGVRTSYAFRDQKSEIWRGVPGSYTYPVWFDGEAAVFHLGKKVPPKGAAVIYALESRGTAAGVTLPVDILKSTLGRAACEPILDIAGRKLRTHHRRYDAVTHRACTCGYTEAIQAFFEKKLEVEKKDDVAGSLDDMVYFVQSHVNRINDYRHFADDMLQYLHGQAASHPEAGNYLTNLATIVQQIPDEYHVQKENMKSMSYAADLVKQTMALTGTTAPDNLNAYMELLKAWRGMGGAQDYVVARCHMIARQLQQEAGYGCADQPGAVAVANEVRARCTQILRNPDGYEIWADY
jgi:hypothetical protein